MPPLDITAGIMVHFVQDNGAHSAAVVTSVTNEAEDTVNLFIMRDDDVFEHYHRQRVKYSDELESRTWHFIEGHKTWKYKEKE